MINKRSNSGLPDNLGIFVNNWSSQSKLHVLDNKAKTKFKAAIHMNICTVKVAPPDMHRRNIAE